MKFIIIKFFCLFAFANIYAQNNTVGVLQNSDESYLGYTFFSPFNSTNAYLVDNCGRLVNQWTRGTRPGLSAYFLDNGLLLRTYKIDPIGPFTSASNAGGLELVDWDNNVVWFYEFNDDQSLSHHDAVMMPNGNLLVLTWELTYTDELIELGRDPNEIFSEGFMWSEKILEIKPIGNNDMEIIWQWEIKDHYIQDFDDTKLNFGVVSEHPELFDINLPELNSNNSNSTRDWNHFNAIDYNPLLDQILISTRNSDEIWIIDHSTTTEEAASHAGGTYGKGGDILYRWGNANAYDRASVAAQKLFGQHGVNWITEGEDTGLIMIYNNGNGRPGTDYSTVEILLPPQSSPGFYDIPDVDPLGPENPEWLYDGDTNGPFFSPYLSNAQRLPNGNTFINAGSPGHIYEVTMEEEIVWEYIIPLSGNSPVPQGSFANNNSTFRAYKYGLDYPGFNGINLVASETIEPNNNPDPCDLVSTEELNVDLLNLNHIYDGNLQTLNVYFQGKHDVLLQIYDLHGRSILQSKLWQGENIIDLSGLEKTMYVFTVSTNSKIIKTEKIIVH